MARQQSRKPNGSAAGTKVKSVKHSALKSVKSEKKEQGLDVDLLERTFKMLAPKGEALVERFYEKLFDQYPHVKPMFGGTDLKQQQRKLLSALALVINNLRKPDSLKEVLEELGAKHQAYGAEPEHFGAVKDVLLSVMKEFAGRKWTLRVNRAWEQAIDAVAEIMLNGYMEKTEMSTMEDENDLEQDFEEEVFFLQSSLDSAKTAIMMIDRDLVITYANQSTIDILKNNEETLRSLYPGFDSNHVIGTCIDTFHKNPEHQRKLLDDPRNLPYETDIHVGPLVFAIRVAAQYNYNGDYVGNFLEWQDATQARASELDVARLQSAVDGAKTNIMICDLDLNITYANPAVINMLSRRIDFLRRRFPGIDPNKLVGQNIDQFHKSPAHQRALLGNKANLPAEAEIDLGEVVFTVSATAILDHQGDLMGNMVEWQDITEQKDAESQIEQLIQEAIEGKLDRRIESDDYQGFMKGLSDGINRLMDTVVSPIKDSAEALAVLAEGDLTQTMDGEYAGEFKKLADSVNSTVSNLKKMVGEIVESSSSIGTASSEIAQGNADLSQRTEEQAASLEETASSMEELTGTVKQNADNASQANQLSAGARDEAEKGGEVADRTIKAMSEINESSKKIADIIGVIDEIAFQTNLLALNAAVEAARAGEQGRGFAVVASEVRNLAQRSAGAAKEIKSLIKDSVEKVDEGTKLVDETGKSLEEIVGSVKKVSDIVAEIAAASQEQATGIEQVNKTVVQMDEATQQNAALVEEAAAASVSLSEHADGLNQLMEFFKVGDDQARISRAPKSKSRQEPAPARAPVSRASKPAASDDEWEEF